MKVNAINNYLVLDMLQTASELKKGVIVLPETYKRTQRWAKVLSAGPGVPDVGGKLYKPDVEVGDTVYVTAHGQYDIHKNANNESDNISAASVLDVLAVLEDMNTLTIQPLGQYIEVEKIEFEDANEFGIQLPDAKKAPTNLGKVVRLGKGFYGPDGTPVPFQVKEGDTIVFNALSVMVVDFVTLGTDEKKYLIKHGDIIGVVENEIPR